MYSTNEGKQCERNRPVDFSEVRFSYTRVLERLQIPSVSVRRRSLRTVCLRVNILVGWTVNEQESVNLQIRGYLALNVQT
jgi:hypothetical protein